MFTVARIIDLFICLEACCHVTSKTINCRCNTSTVVTFKLTNGKVTEFRLICDLARTVCKFRSYNRGNRGQKFVKLLSWNIEFSWFMEGRMHNKRQKICLFCIKGLERKRHACLWYKLLLWWNDIHTHSGKWLNCVVQPCFFLWLLTSHISLFSAVKITFRIAIFYNFK
jgi:hypothetical protein